jgi:hypothetical protein
MTAAQERAAGDVWLCGPGFEATLAAELGPGARPLAGVPGAVAHDLPPLGRTPLDPTFARQLLPRPARIAGESVGELAQAAFDLLAAPLDVPAGVASPWALHVFAVEAEDDGLRGRARYAPSPRGKDREGEEREPSLAGRARLVEAALLERFDRFRKRTLRRRVEGVALAPGDSMAMVALVGREAALVSATRALSVAGAWPEPRWPGGAALVADDPRAPSSAYRKVEEAYLALGVAPHPGERVVDLGGAPGGWSWTALRRGARVLLVDRAPPEAPVLGHPALESRIGDALAYEPDAPVDWLLCDVAATPARTLELLERWLSAGWCRRFVVQTKLKGDDDRLACARALRELLARYEARGGTGRVRHLTHDKNEVTAIGRLGP